MKEKKNTAPNAALLSPLLSRIRHKVAMKKIPEDYQPGAMLDIGCGIYPKLMVMLEPERGVGVDRKPRPDDFPGEYEYEQQDFSIDPELDFADESFDLVSALAVLEHIEPEALEKLLAEIRRILKPGGHLIATMPSGIGDRVLHVLAFLGLSSKTNLEEHQDRYTCRKMTQILLKAGWQEDELDIGRFEMGMNIYIKATRQ